jgi:hypothetical protein
VVVEQRRGRCRVETHCHGHVLEVALARLLAGVDPSDAREQSLTALEGVGHERVLRRRRPSRAQLELGVRTCVGNCRQIVALTGGPNRFARSVLFATASPSSSPLPAVSLSRAKSRAWHRVARLADAAPSIRSPCTRSPARQKSAIRFLYISLYSL